MPPLKFVIAGFLENSTLDNDLDCQAAVTATHISSITAPGSQYVTLMLQDETDHRTSGQEKPQNNRALESGLPAR